MNLLDRWHLLNNFEPLKVGHFAEYIDVIEDQLPQADALLQAAGVDAIYDNTGRLIALESNLSSVRGLLIPYAGMAVMMMWSPR